MEYLLKYYVFKWKRTRAVGIVAVIIKATHFINFQADLYAFQANPGRVSWPTDYQSKAIKVKMLCKQL